MIEFLKRHNLSIQLGLLIVSLWSFSFYNYVSQKELFLKQLQNDSSDLLLSVRSSIHKFGSIENTLSLNALVSSMSFKLDIFEFRYLDAQGVVVSSMFEEEVGKPYRHPGIELALQQGVGSYQYYDMGQFYIEERDLTNVLAISFPVLENGRLYGIIDLAVDVTDLDYVAESSRDAVMRRLQLDTTNLLNAIAGSIISRTKVFEVLNLNDFLQSLVTKAGGVLEVSVLDSQYRVISSSNETLRGSILADISSGTIRQHGSEVYEYLLLAPLQEQRNQGGRLLLAIDASDYVASERKLFYIAVATSMLAILVSVTIAYAIYRINLRRAREENIRLELMVAERTDELKRVSQTDKLTGLANRCHLEEKLEVEFKRAERYRMPLTLAVVDLDFFKKINDCYGHLGGDAVLRELGARLRAELRETDFVGRYGGEEFVVLLTNTDIFDSLRLAEIMRRLIAESPVHFEGQELAVTASIGVAQLQAEHLGHKDIFADADRALYLAKDSGRNCVAYIEEGQARLFVDKRLAAS